MRPPRLQSRPACRRHPGQRGFAIIEALIALLIFSLAVLGLVGMQASLTRAAASSKYRAEAAYLASDLIGRMWIDSANLADYKGSACASHPRCNAWQNRVSAALPSASADISICLPTDPISDDCKDGLEYQTVNRVTVTIRWTAPSEGTHEFHTSTTISPNTI